MRQAGENELAIVTDPPFGGRAEPLVYTFQRLDVLHKELHPHRNGSLSCKSSSTVVFFFPN